MYETSDKQKKTMLVLLGVLLIAAIMVFLFSSYLTRCPFDRQMTMDTPFDAVINDDGAAAIVDSMGSRIFLVSYDGRIISIISYQSLSKTAPVEVTSVAMDDDSIYLLDHIMSYNGRNVVGERVLHYDLKGEYKNTLISTEDQPDGEAKYRMLNLSCNDGRVFATIYDESDGSFIGVADITDGGFDFIHRFDNNGNTSYDIFYQPEYDITTAVAYNGDLFCREGEQHVPISDEDLGRSSVDSLAVLSDGSFITLSQNEDSIVLHRSGEENGVLAQTSANNMYVHYDELVYADGLSNSVHIVDIESGEETVLTVLELGTKDVLLGYLIWGMFVIGSVSLIWLLVLAVIDFVRKRREKLTENTQSEKVMTTASLYGPVFAVMIPVFAVIAFMFGNFYYQEAVDKSHSAVQNTGFILSRTSSGRLGQDLDKIRTQKDYDSEAYASVVNTVSTICMNNTVFEGKTDLSCSVYRFDDDSEDVIVVLDDTNQMRIGTILTADEQRRLDIYEDFKIVRGNHMSRAFTKYDNGREYFAIYAPIYDADGGLNGAAILRSNESVSTSQIKEKMFVKLLEIFTLLAGLAMLSGEIMYLKDMVKIQKRRHRQGIRNTTVIEASRPVAILFFLPNSVVKVFITLIASSILKNTGREGNALLLALPLTVNAITFSLVKSAAMSIVNRRPKFYMFLGIGINIASFVIMLISTLFNSYVLLIASVVSTSSGIGLLFAAQKSFSMSGIEVEPRYHFMVGRNTEGAIASAIGVSLTAVIRGIWGNTGMMVYLIVAELINIPVVMYFVGNDLGAKREVKAEKKRFLSGIKTNMKFLLRPNVFIAVFLAMVPMTILSNFKSYILPLFNEKAGYPECLIGTITLGVQLAALFVIPGITKRVGTRKKSQLYIGAMLAMAGVLLLFAFEESMKTFVPVLAVFALCNSIFKTSTENDIVAEAKLTNINVGEAMTAYLSMDSLGDYSSTLILSFLMIPGFGFLGLSCSVICIACALIILTLSRRGNNPVVAVGDV